MQTPKSITINETHPGGIDHYSVYAKRVSDNVIVASGNFPVQGTVTVCDFNAFNSGAGFFAAVSDGTVVELHLIERIGSGASSDDTDQTVAGGPFTVNTLPNGAETITVQV